MKTQIVKKTVTGVEIFNSLTNFKHLKITDMKLTSYSTTAQKTSSGDAADSASTMPGGKVTMDGELPSKASVPALFDEMDYQQAVQCYLWGLPLVAFAEWRHIHENTFGATSNDLVVYASYEDKLGILTANATTPYILTFIDLIKNGPTVIEMPAGKTAGGLADFWQREVASIGEMGPDKGKGGKCCF